MAQIIATTGGRFVRLYRQVHRNGECVQAVEVEVSHTDVAEQLNTAERKIHTAALVALDRDEALAEVQRALLREIMGRQRVRFWRRLRAVKLLQRQLGREGLHSMLAELNAKKI